MKSETKYCKMCRKKDPPIDTVLEVGVNIHQRRMDHGDYNCNDCYNKRQKDYREGKYAEINEQKHLEAIEELTQAWSDPAYKYTKEIADKVVKIWKKNNWRSPEKGFVKDWICEVLFPDMWNVDPNTVVEEYFMSRPDIPKSKKFAIKAHILEFVSSQIDLLVLGYREKAKNKWVGIVDSVNKKYHGRENLCATPKFKDPVTKGESNNWYLLSTERDRKEREESRESLIESLHTKTNEEKKLIENLKQIERREKSKYNSDNNKEQQEREGGGGGE